MNTLWNFLTVNNFLSMFNVIFISHIFFHNSWAVSISFAVWFPSFFHLSISDMGTLLFNFQQDRMCIYLFIYLFI
jgi:hypothetical protein